ncbi:MAG: hypothetical protein LBK52_08070 [Deltaproteobacteria bacterium]|nr:hypothetical protein [Deltaproteobacteria bacterium]
MIDEVISALSDEDKDDPFEDVLVLTRQASGAHNAFIAGLDSQNAVMEFIGCLEVAKIELTMNCIPDDEE